jgi:predicted transcriptional regulator
MSDSPNDLLGLTAGIVAAYVSRQAVSAADLPALMRTVRDGLVALGDAAPAIAAEPDRPAPTTAEIRQSVSPERLISFIDNKPYKTLKRHLKANDLTPEMYRKIYGLPADYPMVAKDYSERRSALAKAIGLGVPGSRPVVK